jgi:putative flippase GtrA
MDKVEIVGRAAAPSSSSRNDDLLRRYVEKLPRLVRFFGVGGLGLVTDMAVFTIAIGGGAHPLSARLVSLAVATLLTWRLNRALTFDPTGRHQSHEALRYAAVTATAQGTNYAVFAALVVTAFASLPQAALLAGAAVGAVLSYSGHRVFSFARCRNVFPHDMTNHEQEVALR